MSSDKNSDPDEEPRTIFAPLSPVSSPTPNTQDQSAPAEPLANARQNGQIQEGDILNHIFQVRRFIARGGMGEVYEGININTEECVAIKVMLPSLAADPNVQAMFRKEARTLTRLTHPALVQYRVLAQEPQLQVLYIVTDYIDGGNLSAMLGSVPQDAESVSGLLRRLADGLRLAHELGAIHRDIAPDNILLENGLLERARIIDFGIAKDLDPTKGTIVGDGFAGKLNYVAPEQLGDFNREMGPWTDIYSLALVILAVASGRDVDMGATLVDAVDKRRAGVDTSAAPENLRPVLSAMLRANPQDRLRSMTDVIAMLDVIPAGTFMQQEMGTVPGSASAKKKPRERIFSPPIDRKFLIGGAVLIGLMAIVGIAFMIWNGQSGDQDISAGNGAAATATKLSIDDARNAVTAALPSIACSWLDLKEIKQDHGGFSARFSGVAGDTATAQALLSSAISAKGMQTTNISFEDVAPIQPSACLTLDAFRKFKSRLSGNLLTDQVKYEKSTALDGKFSGPSVAKPQVHISADALRDDISLIGVETSGIMTELIDDKKRLKELIASHAAVGSINTDGSITLAVNQTDLGWSGLLLLQGKGPFDPALVAPLPSARGAEWRSKLDTAAMAHGWKADMVWFKIVDEVRDAPAPQSGAVGQQP